MEGLFLNIAGFLACAAVIVYSGSKLSYYGDQIAELTGLGRAWIGLILMASVTSLPELITGISSVAIVKDPDLAAGDIFGSCVFNLLILSVLDARMKKPLFSAVKQSHIVASIFGIILMVVAAAAIFMANEMPAFLWISSLTFLLFFIYAIAMYGIFTYEKTALEQIIPEAKSVTINAPDFKKTVWGYGLNALIVLGGAIFLPYFGENIAHSSGLGSSFFGTLFVAAATSLPELVVSFAALRIGAADMAVGNLLGSNLFNMFILGVDDVFYREGSLFKDISPSHMLSIFVTIIMSAIVGLSLMFKPKKKRLWLLSIDTFIIVLLYLVLITYLFNKK